MNTKWLKRENEAALVLFFNGWGMDEAAVAHLDCSGVDVLMLNDYREPLVLDENVEKYNRLYVVAWSLGVWAAAQVLSKQSFVMDKAIALNGTLLPMDDREGIPLLVLQRTMENWSEDANRRFWSRVMGGFAVGKEHLDKCGQRTIENQQQELREIIDNLQEDAVRDYAFDVALIGKKDMAFPYENMQRYWKNRVRTVSVDIPHYPFLYLLSWKQIIAL